MHTAASQSVFILTILCLVCCWQNPVCLNKTLEAALNFRPPSNSKRSPGSVPAWKLVNPANKDSTASPAVTRKTLAAVLEMSLLLWGPSLHTLTMPEKQSWAATSQGTKSPSPNKIHLWKERGRALGSLQHPAGWSHAPHRLSCCGEHVFPVPRGRTRACVHFSAYPLCETGLSTLESRAHLEAP